MDLLEKELQGLVKRVPGEAPSGLRLLNDFSINRELDFGADRDFELLAKEQKLG